jgi:hypothetical protein
MNDHDRSGTGEPHVERMIRKTAAHMVYPPTPDLTVLNRHRVRTPAQHLRPVIRWAVVVLLGLLMIVLTVPQVRAVVLSWIQIGAIKIIPVTSTESTPVRPDTGGDTLILSSVLDMPNQVTLAQVQSQLDVPIPLSADWGAPDHVFLQDGPGKLISIIWLTEEGGIRLVLEILDTRILAHKLTQVDDMEPLQFNGQIAYWIGAPHWITYFFEEEARYLQRLVSGRVLLWNTGEQTYRLEGHLTQAELLRIAASLGTPTS